MKAIKERSWQFRFMAILVALTIATADLGTPLVFAGVSGLVSVATSAKVDRKPKIKAGDCEAAAMV
jgi:hypothetical protein